MSITVTFIMRDGTARDLSAEVGETLLDVSRKHDISEIEGACGGAMACSTCHVIIDKGWYAKLPRPTGEETDMIDLAKGVTRTSRLGCQIRLTAEMDGLIIRLPEEAMSLL